MSDEPRVLTTEEAIGLLPEGDYIHAFRSTSMAMIGADWKREDLIEAIKSGVCHVGGPSCRSVGHGLAVHANGWLFVQVRDDVDWSVYDEEVTDGE